MSRATLPLWMLLIPALAACSEANGPVRPNPEGGGGGKADCPPGQPCGDDALAIEVFEDQIEIAIDVEVVGPSEHNEFTTSYRQTGMRTVEVPLIVFRNASGLELSFIVNDRYDDFSDVAAGGSGAAFGARLYSATLGDQALLYTNPSVKRSPNWGPVLPSAAHKGPQDLRGEDFLGWLGIGGAESCFPVHEHGYFPATNWSYAFHPNDDGSITFTSWVDAKNFDARIGGASTGQNLDVEVSYTLPVEGEYWRTSVAVANPDQSNKPYQYWHNYMLLAGSEADPHTVEVMFGEGEVSQFEVHSTGDDNLKNADGQGASVLADGGHAVHPWGAGSTATKIHGPRGGDNVQNWLGLFNISGGRTLGESNMVSRYGFYDHDEGVGLAMVSASGERTIYPKAFGGSGIGTGNWTESQTRYTEMWYSTNARSFWDYPEIGPGQRVQHDTIVFPFASRSQFEAFDPSAPWEHDSGIAVVPNDPDPEPEPGDSGSSNGSCGHVLEDFLGGTIDAASAVDASGCDGDCPPVAGTLAEGWTVWFDGGWGGARTLFHDAMAGQQVFQAATGSFGIRADLCDPGDATLTIEHDATFSDGLGWYEIWSGGEMLIKYENDAANPIHLAPGCAHEAGLDRCQISSGEISFKIGTPNGTASATVSSLTVADAG